MILSLAMILALQADVLRPDPPPVRNPNVGLSAAVAEHYKDGLPVIGTLIFPDNAKRKVADVELLNSSGQIIEKVSTTNSKFEFDKVPLGLYFIEVTAGELEATPRELSLTTEEFGTVELTINLHRKPGASKDSTAVMSAAAANAPVLKDAIKEYEKGLAEVRNGDPDKAIPHFEKAIELAPNYFEANLALGLQYKQRRNLDMAIPLLVRAVALNPASAAARSALGQLYFEKKQFQEAVDQLTEDLKLEGASAETYFTLGVSQYRLGNLEKAEEDLRQSLKISEPTMGKAHLALYNVYMEGQRTDEALAELASYLENYPEASNRPAVQTLYDKLKKQPIPH